MFLIVLVYFNPILPPQSFVIRFPAALMPTPKNLRRLKGRHHRSAGKVVRERPLPGTQSYPVVSII